MDSDTRCEAGKAYAADALGDVKRIAWSITPFLISLN